MSAVSSIFRAHFSEHSEKSAISLSLMVLRVPNLGSLLSQSDPAISSITHCAQDYLFELPCLGSGMPNHYAGDLLPTIAISGLSRVSVWACRPVKFHQNNSGLKAEWERLRSGEIDFAVHG
jgi:hypothetical protein